MLMRHQEEPYAYPLRRFSTQRDRQYYQRKLDCWVAKNLLTACPNTNSDLSCLTNLYDVNRHVNFCVWFQSQTLSDYESVDCMLGWLIGYWFRQPVEFFPTQWRVTYRLISKVLLFVLLLPPKSVKLNVMQSSQRPVKYCLGHGDFYFVHYLIPWSTHEIGVGMSAMLKGIIKWIL